MTRTKKRTKPGPDGLPYAAWCFGAAPFILFEVDVAIRNGAAVPPGFNDSLCGFLPKGEAENDWKEVVRDATNMTMF